jgi:hypothetical protein
MVHKISEPALLPIIVIILLALFFPLLDKKFNLLSFLKRNKTVAAKKEAVVDIYQGSKEAKLKIVVTKKDYSEIFSFHGYYYDDPMQEIKKFELHGQFLISMDVTVGDVIGLGSKSTWRPIPELKVDFSTTFNAT